jgi:hypothetical protein
MDVHRNGARAHNECASRAYGTPRSGGGDTLYGFHTRALSAPVVVRLFGDARVPTLCGVAVTGDAAPIGTARTSANSALLVRGRRVVGATALAQYISPYQCTIGRKIRSPCFWCCRLAVGVGVLGSFALPMQRATDLGGPWNDAACNAMRRHRLASASQPDIDHGQQIGCPTNQKEILCRTTSEQQRRLSRLPLTQRASRKLAPSTTSTSTFPSAMQVTVYTSSVRPWEFVPGEASSASAR